MNDQERAELLTEIKAKLDGLVEEFRRVSNGTGFPRCVEREQRIKRLEDDVISMKKVNEGTEGWQQRIVVIEGALDTIRRRKEVFDVWLMRATWMVIIAGIVKFAFF